MPLKKRQRIRHLVISLGTKKMTPLRSSYQTSFGVRVRDGKRLVWVQAPGMGGFLVGSTPQPRVDRAEGENGIAT